MEDTFGYCMLFLWHVTMPDGETKLCFVISFFLFFFNFLLVCVSMQRGLGMIQDTSALDSWTRSNLLRLKRPCALASRRLGRIPTRGMEWSGSAGTVLLVH